METFATTLVYFLGMALAFLLPLVPAYVTYRISPQGKSFAKGPLKGLDIRVSGSFASYLITLLVVSPVSYSTLDKVDIYLQSKAQHEESVWTIKGRFGYLASDDTASNYLPKPKNINLNTHIIPEDRNVKYEAFSIKVPAKSFALIPGIMFVSTWGTGEINMSDYRDDMELLDGQVINLTRFVDIRANPKEEEDYPTSAAPLTGGSLESLPPGDSHASARSTEGGQP